MLEVGRLCVKIAGRDAGKECVILDLQDNKFALIDGATRRKKVNLAHLEPLDRVIEIEKNASHAKVAAAFEELGLPVWNTKPKPQTKRTAKKRRAAGKKK